MKTMVKVRVLPLLLTMLVHFAGSVYAQHSSDQDAGVHDLEGCATRIDRRFQEHAEKGFSGAVLVAVKGEVVLAKGYGMADRAKNIPCTADTVFDIGSITKQFTAAGILILEMEGKLRVTDPITKYFNAVPEDKQRITLHHLLTHTAGFKGSLGGDYARIDEQVFLKKAMKSRLRFEPGSEYAYSNVGYSLLGIIIERLSGQSYESYLREKLFLPAGMQHTGYVLPDWDKVTVAHGYRKKKDWGTPLDQQWDKDGPYWHLQANGGLLSTVNDLHRWAVALQNHTVLSDNAMTKYIFPHVSEGEGDVCYGYGWTVRATDEGHPFIKHNGGNGIFFADMGIHIQEGLSIILCSNSTGNRFDKEFWHLQKMLLPSLMTLAASMTKTEKLPESLYKDYTEAEIIEIATSPAYRYWEFKDVFHAKDRPVLYPLLKNDAFVKHWGNIVAAIAFQGEDVTAYNTIMGFIRRKENFGTLDKWGRMRLCGAKSALAVRVLPYAGREQGEETLYRIVKDRKYAAQLTKEWLSDYASVSRRFTSTEYEKSETLIHMQAMAAEGLIYRNPERYIPNFKERIYVLRDRIERTQDATEKMLLEHEQYGLINALAVDQYIKEYGLDQYLARENSEWNRQMMSIYRSNIKSDLGLGW